MEPVRPARRVALTAIGVVSPLGTDVPETVANLKAGTDAVSPVTMFDVSRCRAKTAGQVRGSWTLDGADAQWHRASHFTAAAMQQVQRADERFRPEAAVIGTTSGGMSFGEKYHRAQIERRRPATRATWLANYMPQKAVLDGLTSCNWSVPSQVIANACASGTNAIGHAFRLIRAGLHRTVLCGGYDAISELVYVGFDSLQASTPEKVRPFDKNRTGLVLGEGAAMLALEEWESARARRAPILAEITGYGIATDNYHLTQPNPSGIGPRLAMERALEDAGRHPAEIDYVNAHGTATTFNDATEGLAIAQIFGRKVPVSSTKSMMGHSLGAAGAIEAVFSVLAIRDGFLPPNINYGEADPAFDVDIIANAAREVRPRRVISNSFGFGGTNATLVMEAA